MKNYKTLDELAYWFEKEYKSLSNKEKKDLLIYECLNFKKIDEDGRIEDKKRAKAGVLTSRFLKKLINPDKEDLKSLLYARYKCLKNLENTINTIVNDNKDYFSKDLCKKEKNKHICCQIDGYGQENIRKFLIESIFSFYLSRYNFKQALKFALMSDKKLILYFALPRLLGSIFASSILVLTATEIWLFLNKVNYFYSIFSLIFVFFYILMLDMKNIMPQINIFSKILRVFPVLIIGFIESFIFAYFLAFIQIKTNFLGQEIDINISFILNLSLTIFLIGIIMNIFWQKDTIPKPL